MSCCGPVPTPECEARALVVAEREFSDPAYFAVHRVTVAAYQLQHPGAPTAHSLAVHRAALEGALVHGLEGEALGRHVRWAAAQLRRRPPAPVDPPAHRGDLTVADVVAARDAATHRAVVRRWAAQVHAAWDRGGPQEA